MTFKKGVFYIYDFNGFNILSYVFFINIEQNINELEKAIKDIREIAGFFKQSAQRINRELEAVNMLFVNGAWQNEHGRRRFWNDVQSVANYF